jgi:hypothetical protein
MKVTYTIPIALLLSIAGCVFSGRSSCSEVPRKLTQETAAGKETPILQIRNLNVSRGTILVEYRVGNPFSHDIWVAEDASTSGRTEGQSAEQRIVDGTLYIDFRFDVDKDIISAEHAFTRYRRLAAGQSHSGMIVLDLPVRNNFYAYWVYGFGRPEEDVVLHRLVLTVGYFVEDLPNLLSESAQRDWMVPGLHYWQPKSSDPSIAFVSHVWEGLRFEQSVQAAVDDINIAAAVPAD